MKIQCGVCNKDDATVFCTADEAALCDDCDHRVHHANKLASKHQRFTLLHPCSPKQVPLCDICQKKRAFLFCQQDRAILCRDCDGPIHSANEHTQKHNRFLLTGVKLSSTSAIYTSSNGGDSVPQLTSQSLMKNTVSSSPSNFNPSTKTATTTTVMNKSSGDYSISEYLMEMLPGWHVEDFLDSSETPFGFCKNNDGMLPFFDTDIDSNITTSQESTGLWVPQSPSSLYPPIQMGGQSGFKETNEVTDMKGNKRWTSDTFTVPQISPPSIGSKRSRPLW